MMGLQEGGLLLIVLYFSVLGLFAVTGDLSTHVPSASSAFNCMPDPANAKQYAGLGTTANCVDINSDSSFNISTSATDRPNTATSILSFIPGGRSVQSALVFVFGTLDLVLLKGWVAIIQAIIGSSPISGLIYFFALIMQIITDLALIYFFFTLLAIISKGVLGR